MESSSLGKTVPYPSRYDSNLLFPIKRPNREEVLFRAGVDRWVCYEFSWLDQNDCPQTCVLHIDFDAKSEFLVESKSLKLYLGSFSQERFGDSSSLLAIIQKDLSRVLKHEVIEVKALSLQDKALVPTEELPGVFLDESSTPCENHNEVKAAVLNVGAESISETVYTHRFRSLCPVTSQPDFASVLIRYAGNRIAHDSITRYLVGFRNHGGFHEACCERIFCDILQQCRPTQLTVACYFTRRGGIEINPVRSSEEIGREQFRYRCSRQ